MYGNAHSSVTNINGNDSGRRRYCCTEMKFKLVLRSYIKEVLFCVCKLKIFLFYCSGWPPLSWPWYGIFLSSKVDMIWLRGWTLSPYKLFSSLWSNPHPAFLGSKYGQQVWFCHFLTHCLHLRYVHKICPWICVR